MPFIIKRHKANRLPGFPIIPTPTHSVGDAGHLSTLYNKSTSYSKELTSKMYPIAEKIPSPPHTHPSTPTLHPSGLDTNKLFLWYFFFLSSKDIECSGHQMTSRDINKEKKKKKKKAYSGISY